MNYHDYDSLLTAVLNSFVTNFNMSHADGIDLTKKIPTLKFVAGMLQATLLTPFQEQGFLYGGFKWITDL
jgi:hypothetical protein